MFKNSLFLFLKISVILLMIQQETRGQETNSKFSAFTTEDGLPNNSINCIYQDKKGFLWFGTDDGLARFDAYNFKIYRHKPGDNSSISSNGVTSVLEDKRGNFWIATLAGGLNKLDKKNGKFISFIHDPAIPNTPYDNNVNSLFEDRDGNIWLSTWGGVTRYNPSNGVFTNIFRIDSVYKENFLKRAEEVLINSRINYRIQKPGNYFKGEKTFSLNKAAKLLVIGEGEIVGPDYFDYGWIEDESGKTVWTMRDKNNFRAGGDVKNRIVIEVITLQEGKYKMKFRTDDSHSYNEWNGVQPDNSELWGLSCAVLENEESVHSLAPRSADYSILPGLNHYSANEMLQDANGNYWVATYDGITSFSNNLSHFKNFFLSYNQTSVKDIRVMKPFNQRQLIIGSSKGVFLFNKYDGSITPFQFPGKPALYRDILNATDILIEAGGVIWITTSGSGIVKVDSRSGKTTHYSSGDLPGGMMNQTYSRVMRDRSGVVWFVLKNEGLLRYNPIKKDFRVIRRFGENEVVGRGIRVRKFVPMLNGKQAMITENGDAYIVSINDGLTDSFLKLKLDQKAKCAAWSSDGQLCIGTDRGLRMIDPASGRMTAYSTGKAAVDKGSIEALKYSGQKLVIGAGEYLYSYDKGLKKIEKQIHVKPDSISIIFDFNVKDLEVDELGLVWVLTFDGVFRISEQFDRIERYSRPRGVFGSNQFISFYDDKKGSIWTGTSHSGMVRINKISGELTNYTRSGQMPFTLVCSITGDQKGRLWLGTDKGIVRFDPRDRTTAVFTREDGLPSNKFITGASALSESGFIFMGSASGIIYFEPGNINVNNYLPPLVFSELTIMNTSQENTEEISELEGLTLQYNQNYFTIKLASLNYLNSARNNYAYKLEGLDRDWHYPGTYREITYTNLPPGDYILRIRGTNDDGIWNNSGNELSITILPPWYKSWWAIILYIAVLTSIYFTVRNYELNKVKMRNDLRLRQLEAEKLIETDRIKTNFFANISHELRTPLTLILEPIGMLRSSAEKKQRRTLDIVERNARRLLQLINQLLDISKIEAGHMKLSVRKSDFVKFFRHTVNSFESAAALRGIELVFFCPVNELFIYFDEDKLEKIIANLLSNALKFTGRGGKIFASAELRNQRLEITVKDTGVGIPADSLEKIFDRFSQLDSGSTREFEGTGIGLALVKELTEIHKGKISVESEPGKGAIFTVMLHSDERVYTEDEKCDRDEIIAYNEIFIPDCENGTLKHSVLPGDPEKPLILVVEDNPDMRDFIISVLGEGYRTLEAANGVDALALMDEISPDMIVSDVMMPKMDGFELCRRIKSHPESCHIPVILLTAKAGTENRIEGLETGADDYLIKPFNRKELLVRIANLVESRKRLRENLTGDLFGKKQVQPKENRGLNGHDKKLLSEILTALETNFNDPEYDVEQLSRTTGQSQSNLRRKTSALLGKSPNEVIRLFRLQKAEYMIREEGASVSEAAYSCGFNNLPYFTKCFREEFHYLPSEINK